MIPERTYYVTNLSKTLAPGLRIGYMTIPSGELASVERVIASTTWMNPPLVCEVASRWIEDGTVERVLAQKKQLVKKRIAILSKKLAKWKLTYRPSSLHGWLELPQPWKSEAFARQAAGMGVQVVPSSNFATHGHYTVEAVRICIGPPESETEVQRGAEILASLLAGNRAESTPIM
jgi:DNA-binding transcriptional MocR family regulator